MSDENAQHVVRLKKMLGERLRVTLVGGRVLTGEFQALDKQGNLVMGRATDRSKVKNELWA